MDRAILMAPRPLEEPLWAVRGRAVSLAANVSQSISALTLTTRMLRHSERQQTARGLHLTIGSEALMLCVKGHLKLHAA